MGKREGCHNFESSEHIEHMPAHGSVNLISAYEAANFQMRIGVRVNEPQARFNFGAHEYQEQRFHSSCHLPPLELEYNPNFCQEPRIMIVPQNDYYGRPSGVPGGYWEANGPLLYQPPCYEAPPAWEPAPVPPSDYAAPVPAPCNESQNSIVPGNNDASHTPASTFSNRETLPELPPPPANEPVPAPRNDSQNSIVPGNTDASGAPASTFSNMKPLPELPSPPATKEATTRPAAVPPSDVAQKEPDARPIVPSTQPGHVTEGDILAAQPSAGDQSGSTLKPNETTAPTLPKDEIDTVPLLVHDAPPPAPAVPADPAPDAEVMADDIIRLARNIKSNGGKDQSHFSEKAILQDLQVIEKQDGNYQLAIKQKVENAGAWYNRTPYMTLDMSDRTNGAALVIKINADYKNEKITADTPDPITKW